jgi:hypothetical protein
MLKAVLSARRLVEDRGLPLEPFSASSKAFERA